MPISDTLIITLQKIHAAEEDQERHSEIHRAVERGPHQVQTLGTLRIGAVPFHVTFTVAFGRVAVV